MTDRPHVLVTGTSRGIGAAIRDRLAPHARVLGHASRAQDADTLAADLDDPAAAAGLWDAALDRLDGRIDVLVANAGIFEAAPLALPEEAWIAAWERTMRVNLTAAAILCRRAAQHMAGRGGRIVAVASRAAYRGDSPDHWHYAASKAGMVAMVKSIARGHAADGLLAFAVCPGFVATAMAGDYLADTPADALRADIPLGRVATPAEVADAVAFLALDAPPSMTGAVLDLNGASYVR